MSRYKWFITYGFFQPYAWVFVFATVSFVLLVCLCINYYISDLAISINNKMYGRIRWSFFSLLGQVL